MSTSNDNPLSPRNIEVLQGFAAGMQISAIAHKLDLQVTSINRHSRAIKDKLGASTLAEAIAVASSRGII